MSTSAIVEHIVHTIAETAVANERYFCDLDAVVGDGDFGYSLARGFEVVLETWPDLDRSDDAALLRHVATTITSRTGGTSGPIWGTALLRAAGALRQADLSSDVPIAVAALRASIQGIKDRGKAEQGDKTLLDALIPAVDALEKALGDGATTSEALERTAHAAREAAEATKDLQARRGRASYTGTRSVGSVDPGAIAVAVMAEEVARRSTAALSPASPTASHPTSTLEESA